MIKTIIGLILFLSPFLLLEKFRNKRDGFLKILTLLITFHLFLAILSQVFNVFFYSLVLVINGLLLGIVFVKTNFSNLFEELKKGVKKIDWVLVSVIVISAICLFSVHYNYTGTITSFEETNRIYKEVENFKYSYPYFSDEWYAVSLIEYSIDSHSLPLENPLSNTLGLVNLEFPFHSFLSEIILLLDLKPLIRYSLLASFSGILICLIIYLFFKGNGINNTISGIGSLSCLYLINGANLPGIWYLIPLILGIISFLLTLYFLERNDNKMILLGVVLTLLFYPPLFIFLLTVLFCDFVFLRKQKFKKLIKKTFYFLTSIVLVGIIISISYFLIKKPAGKFISYFLSKIYYQTFTPQAIPDFSIFKVIPWPILIFGFLGLIITFKKKIHLVSIVFLGLIYWLLYSFVTFRVIIEYERVVIFTSIIIVILAGFGLSYLFRILKQTNLFGENKILTFFQIGVLIVFFLFSFSYTQRDNWKQLKLHHLSTGQTFSPGAPANRYLHPDDLKLFGDIEKKNFISSAWKGTVVGVATNNYPLFTKPGTISNNIVNFRKFIQQRCEKKSVISEKYDINYVYSPRFNCEDFKLIGKSKQGFYLYKFQK